MSLRECRIPCRSLGRSPWPLVQRRPCYRSAAPSPIICVSRSPFSSQVRWGPSPPRPQPPRMGRRDQVTTKKSRHARLVMGRSLLQYLFALPTGRAGYYSFLENMSSPPKSRFYYPTNTRREKQIYHIVQQSHAVLGEILPTDAAETRDSTEPSRPRPGELVARIFRNWWIELLALALLLITFSGMIAVLRYYQQQPIPQWPLGFSINTALSVFGLAFKGPLLYVTAQGIGQLKWQWFSTRRPLSDLSTYDDASRGPWGSTKLLLEARWRHFAAFLGALITVVALGVDPFTQAIVSYYGCSTGTDKATSNVSRLNSYFTRGSGYGLSTQTRVAIDTSLSDSTIIMPPHVCTAASCTISEPYHSIGLCSQCDDLTDQLDISCNPERGSGCNYTLSAHYFNSVANTTARLILPADAPSSPETNHLSYNMQVLAVNKYPDVRGNNPSGYMVPAGTFGTTSHLASTIDVVSAAPILGSRCSIFWCVRTYTSTIESGILKETLQSTASNWSSWESVNSVLGTVNVGCLSPKVRSRLLSDGYVSPNTEWMSWNGTYLNGTESDERISNSNNQSIPIQCAYQAQLTDGLLNSNPKEAFSDPLTGVLNASGIDDKAIAFPNSASTVLTLWNNATVSAGSISGAFDNFTTAVTNYLRGLDSPIPKNLEPYAPSDRLYSGVPENIPDNPVQGLASEWNQPALGKAFKTTTCIHVRWPWLALPAVLVVSTFAFLFTLIIQTADQHSREVWKSSQDALLWHGLHGPVEDESTYLLTTKEMRERAKEVTVQLRKTTRGWKLSQEEF